MAYEPKISRARFTVRDYSPREMVSIAETLRQTIFVRLDQALDVNDQPAPSLAERYAKYKMRTGRKGVRDLNLTGETRRAIKVLKAGPNSATLGPIQGHRQSWRLRAGKSSATYAEVLFYNNRRSLQWGVSPRDMAEVTKALGRLRSAVEAKVA
jgi:hypothetical protein